MTPSEADKGKTTYRLKFVPDALKEWQALDGSIKEPLRKALKKRLEQPHVPGAELRTATCVAVTRSNYESKDTVWSIWLRTMFLSFLCLPSTGEKTWRLIMQQCSGCLRNDNLR